MYWFNKEHESVEDVKLYVQPAVDEYANMCILVVMAVYVASHSSECVLGSFALYIFLPL